MCNNIGDIMRCVCSIVEQFSVFTSFLLVLEFELSYREPSKNISMVSNSFLLFATFGQQSRYIVPTCSRSFLITSVLCLSSFTFVFIWYCDQQSNKMCYERRDKRVCSRDKLPFPAMGLVIILSSHHLSPHLNPVHYFGCLSLFGPCHAKFHKDLVALGCLIKSTRL